MLGKSLLDFELISKVSRWHFKYFFKKQGLPLLAVLFITSRCNFKCKMCEIISNESWKNQPDMSLDMFKSIIDDLQKLGCYYVYITGGEPTILKDIIERVDYAKKKIPYVGLVTNGYFINNEIAIYLNNAKLDILSISIDGMSQIHNEIRGKENAFEKAINSLEIITNNTNLRVCINTIIAPWNIKDLSNVLAISKKFNTYHKFQPINLPFSSGLVDYDFFNIREEELILLDEFTVELLKEKHKTKRILNGNYYIKKIPDYFRSLSIGKTPVMYGLEKDCILPYFHIEIQPDCTVHPCNYNQWKDKYSITTETSLCEIIHSDDYKKLQKSLRNCKNCNQYMFLCYLEPRYTMPIQNFIKYKLFRMDF